MTDSWKFKNQALKLSTKYARILVIFTVKFGRFRSRLKTLTLWGKAALRSIFSIEADMHFRILSEFISEQLKLQNISYICHKSLWNTRLCKYMHLEKSQKVTLPLMQSWYTYRIALSNFAWSFKIWVSIAGDLLDIPA